MCLRVCLCLSDHVSSVSVSLSVCLSASLSLCGSVCLSVCLLGCVDLSIGPFIYLPALSTPLSAIRLYLSVYLSVPVLPFIHPSVSLCLSTPPSLHLFIPSFHLSLPPSLSSSLSLESVWESKR